MKKLLFAAIFILAGLYVSAQDAVIEQVAGTVEIKQPKETSFKKATNGEKLFQDTVISTSFKSFAIVRIGSTTITVRPLTLLSLTEIQKLDEVETVNVSLQAGRVRVDVKPPAGTKVNTTVHSPSATASVRGTSFEFDTNYIYVSEGTVSFTGNKGQGILVIAGGSSRTDQTGQVITSRDEKNVNLMPPSPAGTGAGDSAVTGPAPTGVSFTISLNFQ